MNLKTSTFCLIIQAVNKTLKPALEKALNLKKTNSFFMKTHCNVANQILSFTVTVAICREAVDALAVLHLHKKHSLSESNSYSGFLKVCWLVANLVSYQLGKRNQI